MSGNVVYYFPSPFPYTLNRKNRTVSESKKGLFITNDGKNLIVTFILVSSLFLLWGTCNGMIDTMDKHFQQELGLSKSQSAWVQFAHYLGYFLMALPAGWLAVKLGYKGGIISGLLLVAAGGFWFMPATNINAMAHAGTLPGWLTALMPGQVIAFVAFLAGVCAIAAGLTFLETVANPYTTVLGSKRYAATRINLAQSCNGVGWVLGPLIGGLFFYTTDKMGRSTGSETLYIPYLAVGIIVLVLSVIFYFAYIPDIKTEDEYHLDDSTPSDSHSIWTHPHFVFAVVAQFLYVAAQAGIFSFFINYMTEEVPSLPASWQGEWTKDWLGIKTKFSRDDIQNLPALAEKLKQKPDAVSDFLSSRLSPETQSALADYKDAASDPRSLRAGLVQDLNKIVQPEAKKADREKPLYDEQRFHGIALEKETRQLLAQKPEGLKLARLNRLLLQDAYPGMLTYHDGIIGLSDQVGAYLLAVGYFCFFIGRYSGANLLKRFSAHKILGLYGVLNVVVCFLIFLKLSWLSVVSVFLSFLFMSIMFPTIFALGIFGLGARAKKASAFIVMAIMGGAVLPKLMGYVADEFDMSRGFIVPMICFVFIALYGFFWPRLSKAESLHGAVSSGGH